MPIHYIFLVSLLLLCRLVSADSTPSNVNIAIGEWPPYASQTLPHKGLLPFVVKRAFAYSNIDVSFEFMSWEDAYSKTLSGEYDISPGWVKTDARKKDMHFSQAMSYIDLRFFHSSSDKFSWDTIEDIYPLTLGLVNGYSYGEKIDKAVKNKRIHTHQYNSDKEALYGISNQEIDIYPADSMVATYILNTLPSEVRSQITLDEHTITHSPIFLIGKSGATETLINAFNLGLNTLIESGEYTKILENFHLINKIGQLNFLTEDNAPINYKGKKGPAGIMVAVIHAILKELGADIDSINIQITPWARAYQTLEQEKNTVLFALTKTKQREKLFKWVGPIYRSNIILLGLKKNFSSELSPSLDKIMEKNICAVKNDVGEQLWKNISSHIDMLSLVSHPSQCAKMLSLERVDLWATGDDTSRWHIQNNHLGIGNFKEVYQLQEAFRYIAFSSDIDNEVINGFQKTLNYLHLSGKLNELIQGELKKADLFAKQSPFKQSK